MLSQIGRRSRNEIGRLRKHAQLLSRDVRKAVMAGQQVLGRVGRRILVHAHDRYRTIDVGKIQIAGRAVKQRKQQADGHQQNQRQPAKPTSDFHVCYHAAELRHRRASEPLSPVNFKTSLRQLRIEYYYRERNIAFVGRRPPVGAPRTYSRAGRSLNPQTRAPADSTTQSRNLAGARIWQHLADRGRSATPPEVVIRQLMAPMPLLTTRWVSLRWSNSICVVTPATGQ